MLTSLANLIRAHPFSVAQIAALMVFVASSTVAGFLVRAYAGWACLAAASLAAILILGQGEK